MKAVIEFETRLANITTPSDVRRDESSLYHLMTVEELQVIANFVSKSPMIRFDLTYFYFRLSGETFSKTP